MLGDIGQYYEAKINYEKAARDLERAQSMYDKTFEDLKQKRQAVIKNTNEWLKSL